MPEWVIEGRLARACRPGYPSENVPAAEVERWLDDLRAMGIRSIICLLATWQLEYYREVPRGLLDRYRCRGLDVTLIPITDPAHDPRGYEELQSRLEDIYRAFVESRKPVLVHCSAGRDRTGRAVQYIVERAGRNHAGAK